MDLGLEGQVAIITGGAGEFGRAIALSFTEEGVDTVIADIDEQKAIDVAKEVECTHSGRKVLPIKTDVTDRDGVKEMVKRAIDQYGKIEILINNAGLIKRRNLLEIDDEFWNKMMDVNLRGALYCSQECIPIMEDPKYGGRSYGRIIMMSSSSGDHTSAGMTVYSITKVGLEMMAQTITAEHAKSNVIAIAPRPGVAPTEGYDFISYAQSLGLKFDGIRVDAKRVVIDYYKKQMPLGRVGTPEEVGKIVVLLASPIMEAAAGSYLNFFWGRR